MEVIQSFTIDHTHLKPGIYVSREDKGFTTFDLRITEPNKEPAVAPAAMHSLEHLMATWFRNSEAKDDVVYVGGLPDGHVHHHERPRVGRRSAIRLLHRGRYATPDHRVPGVDSHARQSARHRTADLRQLPAARPADVQMGKPTLSRPPAARLSLRVHQAASHARRRYGVCRRIGISKLLQTY